MATVGILGGGQLGLMVAESLDRLGQDVVVLEADPDSPCAQRRSNVIRASPTDAAALATFFARVDIATFDSENTPAPPLVPYAAKLAPSLRVLEITQDRAKEKSFIRDAGFRNVKFEVVPVDGDVRAAARAFGLPCIAKSVLGGHDGKGQEACKCELARSMPSELARSTQREFSRSLPCECVRDMPLHRRSYTRKRAMWLCCRASSTRSRASW